jgi:hypothetical protein
MRYARVTLMLVIVIGFSGCKSAPRDQEAGALIKEANSILAQSTNVTSQWSSEYMKAFNPQNRAQFPANRDSLRTAADKVVKALDDSSRLSNQALEKYEQAIELITDEQQRRGTTLLVEALKTSQRTNDLLKSQMALVSDDKLVTAEAFNERFMQLAQQIAETSRENEAKFNEARRLLKM